MSNMSYCRFRNTLGDLHDCAEAMHDNDLSRDEYEARTQLVLLAAKILKRLDIDLDDADVEGTICENFGNGFYDETDDAMGEMMGRNL